MPAFLSDRAPVGDKKEIVASIENIPGGPVSLDTLLKANRIILKTNNPSLQLEDYILKEYMLACISKNGLKAAYKGIGYGITKEMKEGFKTLQPGTMIFLANIVVADKSGKKSNASGSSYTLGK